MHHVTTNDGVQMHFKDWGARSAPPRVLHRGWPLTADDWDAQMLFFLEKGFRTACARPTPTCSRSSAGELADRVVR